MIAALLLKPQKVSALKVHKKGKNIVYVTSSLHNCVSGNRDCVCTVHTWTMRRCVCTVESESEQARRSAEASWAAYPAQRDMILEVTMDRRAFIWMALAALAGAGCVPRSSGRVMSLDAGATSHAVGALPASASTAQAEAIFKEFTGSAWDQAFTEDNSVRWMSNEAADFGVTPALLPGADSSAASPALSGTKRTLPAPQSRDAKVDASEKQKPRPEKKSGAGPCVTIQSGFPAGRCPAHCRRHLYDQARRSASISGPGLLSGS